MINKEAILNQIDHRAFYKDLIPSLKENGKNQATGLCPFHDDHDNPNLSVNLENGLYYCFACNAGGDVFKFYQDLRGVDFKTALSEIALTFGIEENPKAESKRRISKTYDYTDAAGNLIFQVVRYEPKGFSQRRPDPKSKGRWIYNLDGVTPVLYNLSEVIKADTVFLVEGEKDCENLKNIGLTATTSPMGAGKWRHDYAAYLKGKNVVILPDNDQAGKDHTLKAAASLAGVAKSVKVIELSGLPEKGDVSDWLDSRDAKEPEALKAELLGIAQKAPEWKPGKENKAPEWKPGKENTSLLPSLESWQHIQSLDIKVEWIVDRVIPKESITLVFGKGGIGKTWLTLDMARCIGSGIPYLGLSTIKAPVIFIDFENPLAVLNARTQKLGDAENVHFWRASNEKIKPPKLDSNDWEEYKKLPKGSVLIFDTLRASHGKDENASDGMSLIMERLKELRDMGFTIILLHHTAKNSDKVAKGSTAIVDLADHNLGLTLVKKKQGGQDIVIEDDEDTEDEAVYKFGFGGKTRFEPYHIYLTLNPDRGFELAPDPQEDTLKEMHSILAGLGKVTKTVFVENCKGLGAVNKIRKLVDIGQGRYWDVVRRPDQKNAQFVIPKSSFTVLRPYIGCKTEKLPDTPKNDPVKLDTPDSPQTLDSIELDSFTDPLCKTEKLNLREGVL